MRAARLGLAALALLFVGLTSSASAAPNAATHAVSIANFAFSPPTVTIDVGDSVKWTNLDAAVHSAVGQGGTFNTGNLTTNQSMTIAFNTAGTFAYVCGIHGASMSGTVIVRSAATAPPTPAPTAPPTVVPTARPTVAPTPQRTVAPTPEPTAAPAAPTPEPAVTPTATIAPTPTLAVATTAPVAVSSPSAAPATVTPRGTAAAAQDGPPVPLIVGGAAAIVIGLGALAWVLLRR